MEKNCWSQHRGSYGMVKFSKILRAFMRKNEGGMDGTIVNIAAMFWCISGSFSANLKASKYGFIGFTGTLRHELNFEKFAVRVIAICPRIY